ncbi:MAG: GNAT family N-acetyltransferase [Saprospiraceae bacterium]
MTFTITTDSLTLYACDESLFNIILQGNEALAQTLHCKVPENWSEFGLAPMHYALTLLKEDPSHQTWFAYLPIHTADNMLIGSGGYKGKPQNGIVEIGYEIIPAYRGRGLATQMAKALIQRAFAEENVHTVMAHTLGEENASGSILKKCGMHFVRELFDPGDGKIWAWKLEKG